MEQLNKYELARVLGARALQISMGAPFLVKLSEKDLENLRFSPIEIAKLELKEGVIPIKIKEYKSYEKKVEVTPKYFDQTKLE